MGQDVGVITNNSRNQTQKRGRKTGGNTPLFLVAMRAAGGLSLTPADKLVFAYLATRQGTHVDCWPSLDTIASDLEMDRRNCRRSILRLEKAGCIQKVSAGQGGRGHSNRYTVFAKARPIDTVSDGESASIDPPNNKRNVSSMGARPKDTPARGPKAFMPPTVEEVQAYAASRGNPNFDARRFVDGYAAADWHDSKGTRVRSWKQKYVMVWERDNGSSQDPKDTLTTEPVVRIAGKTPRELAAAGRQTP